MKTTFIFIRHAQSVAKERGIVQGRGDDIPLSSVGVTQAKKLVGTLRGVKFHQLFTSASVRAVKTAEPVHGAYPDIPYEEITLLHERSKGKAEGMTSEEFKKKYPEIEEAWEREEDPRIAGGESFLDVERRVMPIIEEHRTEHRGKTLLYIIHGNVIRVILGAMLGIPPKMRNRINQDYCAISIAEFDQKKVRWKVKAVNCPNFLSHHE